MNKYKDSIVVTVTGPSGAGKSFLAMQLKENYKFQEAVSTTTRQMRAGEKNGVSYYFVNKEDFKKRKENNMFIETVTVNDNYYGIEIDKLFASGYNIPAVIVAEPNGVKQIKEFCNKNGIKNINVFIDSPINILEERMIDRCYNEIVINLKDSNSKALLIHYIKFLEKKITKIEEIKNFINKIDNLNDSDKKVIEKINKSICTIEARLKHIHDFEIPEWVNNSKVNDGYDIIIDSFNKDNNDKIINKVLERVRKETLNNNHKKNMKI